MTRVLVTGATGLVGGATLAALHDAPGVEVVAYVRDPARLPGTSDRATVAAGDLRDDVSLGAALAGVDAVVLVSGHGLDMADVQRAAIATIGRAGVRRVVKISGSPVATLSRGGSSIGRTHLDIEDALRSSVPEPVVIRPNVFMQNLLAMAPAIAHGVLPGPEGDPAVSFIDASDVGRAAAAAALAAAPRSRFEITGPESVSYSRAAETLSDVLGRAVAYAPIAVEVMRQGLQAGGDPTWLADHKVEMAALMGEPEAAVVNEHFADLVGAPPTTLREFFIAHAHRLETPS